MPSDARKGQVGYQPPPAASTRRALYDAIRETRATRDESSPAGTIVDYVGTAAPEGWVLLQGQTITNFAILYPEAWAIIPAGWKSGNNATMPDTRGRVTVGLNSGDTDFDTIGETRGAKTHTLATTEMPVHNHTMSGSSASTTHGHADTFSASATTTVSGTGAHQHDIRQFGTGGSTYGGVDSGTSSTNNIQTEAGDGGHSHTASTSVTISGGVTNETAHVHGVGTYAIANAGGSGGATQPHNNIQPSIVFTKIMRVY